jgi:uncharacterized membrane protein
MMDYLQAIFRWAHIVAGITWIGLLYFFNWVNGQFAATLDGPTKKVVVPQLMPRALFWFRWGAAWTWITGVLLLLVVFYHGGAALADPEKGFGLGALLMILITFIAFLAYDQLYKSGLGKNVQAAATIAFFLTALVIVGFVTVGGFGYRGYVIHTGAMFGTIMAANVWMRIWPAQQKIIAATKEGTPPDPALLAVAGTRSRHNTYLSVPLVWTMINSHTTAFARPPIFCLLVAILVGWWAVNLLYKKAAKVPGF